MNRIDIDQKLATLGLELLALAPPIANFLPCVRSGSTLYISGQIPMKAGKPFAVGRVGREIPVAQAREAARLCALAIISHVREHLCAQESVHRVSQVQGFVNAGDDFTEHPAVINGASDLMVQVFGDLGRHSRFAVGVASLPFGVPVEVAAIFELGSN
ncbi:MAG: RidA family protein [Pseudomonadota bacterium]|nr:RidA family protein [Pseudomonadota bacterium]